MADHSKIEWTEATWNPIAGCSVVSPGCTNCYAMRRVAPRLAANPATPHYAGTVARSKGGYVWTGKLNLAPESVLLKPLNWLRPRMIFVNSTSDLFHEAVPDAWIDRIFAVMALCPQHTFQVLTKRPARMRAYLSEPRTQRRIYEEACDLALELDVRVVLIAPGIDPSLAPPGPRVFLGAWPLPNVWLGTSVEDQARADERIPELLATPAAVRFISAEPLLGPVDLTRIDVAAWLRTLVPGSDAGRHPFDPDMRWPLLAPFEHMQSGFSSPGLSDHAGLLEAAMAVVGMVVLSGYPHPLYDRLDDAGWARVEAPALADGARPRTEVLWLNPACVAALERTRAQLHLFDGGAVGTGPQAVAEPKAQRSAGD